MESRLTIKGQQKEYSHKKRTAACSTKSGTEIVWISVAQRRARGLLFLIGLKRNSSNLLIHILQLTLIRAISDHDTKIVQRLLY